MPGDYDIEYASPWAGANYMPASVRNTKAEAWDKATWGPLEELAAHQSEAGVHFQGMYRHGRQYCYSVLESDELQNAKSIVGAKMLAQRPRIGSPSSYHQRLGSRTLYQTSVDTCATLRQLG